jgi:hypothetical protein
MMETTERNQQLFTALVAMFQFAAMQQMGKIKNPLSDALERNLEAARESIDILDMIKSKTRGNLSTEESRLLEQVLQDLKLNFVDETAKAQAPPEPKSSPGTEPPSEHHEQKDETPS